MNELEKPIQFLKGVGPKLSEKLHRLGISTTKDLLLHWPRRYEDYTNVTKISDIGSSKIQVLSEPKGSPSRRPISKQYSNSNDQLSNIVTIKARILGVANKYSPKRHMKITEAVVEDGSGSIKLVWFNQPFLKDYLKPGSEWFFHGKVSYDNFGGGFVMESPIRRRDAAIVPVYPETRGVNSSYINKLVSGLRTQVAGIGEYLPDEILEHNKLYGIGRAISEMHFPKSLEALGNARKRVAFDELLLIALRSKITRREIQKEKAPTIKIDEKSLKEYIDTLPFSLTDDQRKAAWQIIKDLEKPMPMNRLLNGDVGSGKTVVAAIAAIVAIENGYQVALMVPTEVLATQHYSTFCKLFEKENISVGLLTSSQKRISKSANQQISNQTREIPVGTDTLTSRQADILVRHADIIIGTQALIQQKVELKNVALVIVDEQHRFGVKQRAAIQDSGFRIQDSEESDNWALKTGHQKMRPHFLSMTATPIPRTLHLSLFGDLDISVITEKPKDRKEIKTRYVEPQNRMKAYDFIRRQIEAGRQAFVICPLIEETDSDVIARSEGTKQSIDRHGSLAMTTMELFDIDRKSVTKEYEKLRKEIFPELKVAMLHGKMKSAEKEGILSAFAKGESNILVSTSVIEVGIDVPNATVMMIEDADRFGLAQIHQFRGRVGRAEHQSFCFLFSNTFNQKALSRLKNLEIVSDGFKLAEIDLENRGPGDLFGVMQSGQLELKMASFSDRILINAASRAAEKLLSETPDLEEYPLLRQKLREFESSRHME